MKKLLAALLLASAVSVAVPSATANADAICGDPWPHKVGTPIDYVTVLCTSGKGWIQVGAFCYKVTYVIDDGVVVDVIKKYLYREGPAVFKAREAVEDQQLARVDCPSTYPIVEGNKLPNGSLNPLRPIVYLWTNG